MAQASAHTGGNKRQQTNIILASILLLALIGGVVYLFLSPKSPLRPQASTLTNEPAANSSTPQSSEFRDGQVNKISGDTVTVDEVSGGSFSFKLNDEIIVRGLNNNTFEVVERSRLSKGDFISVFYQNTENVQRISRVDIIKEAK